MQLDNPLWRYALRVYSQPSVEPACLAAQAAGLHVNTLMLCCWLATQGEVYQTEDYARVCSLWRDPVLLPLRRIRYQVRELHEQCAGMQVCYEQLKQAELAAEQVELAWLWQVHQERALPAAARCAADRSPEMLARQNIARYLNAVDLNATTQIDCCNQLVDVVLACHW
ncbi:TIGR02444 family protein [Nitrincola sp. A-D6]|uniref:TIGR02444 family protein n=1 Tax=Nitrincola sp. A-D6 TaxID=1545442 RepID=UPI00068FC2DE|nr:TIGR02444 family protein [Nitrincola sp. A-D6]